MACQCRSRSTGNTCLSNPSVRTINIRDWDQLSEIELRGNGGCGGGGSVGRGDANVSARGGDGGNGGGGLYISASAYNFDSLRIDTSGEDGSQGDSASVSGSQGSSVVRGGSGAGGNAGRIILVEDGSPSTIGRVEGFVLSQRGAVINSAGSCNGLLGDTNENRDEAAVVITRLNCPQQLPDPQEPIS